MFGLPVPHPILNEIHLAFSLFLLPPLHLLPIKTRRLTNGFHFFIDTSLTLTVGTLTMMGVSGNSSGSGIVNDQQARSSAVSTSYQSMCSRFRGSIFLLVRCFPLPRQLVLRHFPFQTCSCAQGRIYHSCPLASGEPQGYVVSTSPLHSLLKCFLSTCIHSIIILLLPCFPFPSLVHQPSTTRYK